MIKQLAITGFHRSGSSLTAQYLHNSGLNMGRKLLGAMPSNPYGHYEDIAVVQINDNLLENQGGSWFNDHALYGIYEYKLLIRIQNYLSYRAITHSQFAFKDPRLCVTARSWLTASNSLKFLYIHRGAPRSCHSLWHRAYEDYKAGKATNINKRLIMDKSSIYNLYLNNVGNFISTVKSLQNWKDRILFISYDDLVNENIDLAQILNFKWGFETHDASISEYFDPHAVTLGSELDYPLDNKYHSELERLDKQILDYCGENK